MTIPRVLEEIAFAAAPVALLAVLLLLRPRQTHFDDVSQILDGFMDVPQIKAGMEREQLEGFMSKARAASTLLKALSHETRLLILCILSQGEKTVGEIEAILGLQQAVVSQQLARLRLEHIVTTRREGRSIYYSISDPSLTDLVSVLYEMYCGPKAAPVVVGDALAEE